MTRFIHDRFAKEFLEELPDKEEGHILFIPFFISNAKDVKVPLKMLKEFLAMHPEITAVVYYKKVWQSEFRSFELIKNSTETLMGRMHTRVVSESRRLRIHPPEMVPLCKTAARELL